MHLRWIAPALTLAFATTAHAGSGGLPIGGGLAIPLEGSWKVLSMENYAMRMPEVRKMVADAQEFRIRRPETGILISYMKIKPDRNFKVPNDTDLAAENAKSVSQSSTIYLPRSVETEAKTDTQASAGLVVSLATFHARQGEQFNVAGGYPGGCVTTGAIRRGVEVWSISVASESCESDSHKAAVKALLAASPS